MIDTVLQIVFWLSAICFLTPFAIYPSTLFLLSRLRKERRGGEAKPGLTLVISAYNEKDFIRQKIENALALEYPRGHLEVMVISDASDDGTDDIVREYQDRSVRLCRQEERDGKSAGLSKFCPEAKGEILVFTDANSMFRPDAMKHLLRHFDDPNVGYSVGRQLYENLEQSASAQSENIYWNVELYMKAWESRLSSVVGADGAIYALRKELFEPLAAEDINDFYLPLKVVAKGYRGVYDWQAVCFEDAAPSFQGEFRRKYRIVNRSLKAVTKVPSALNPFRVGWFAYQLLAHKVLRWLSPFFMAILLVTSGWLAMQGWLLYQLAFGVQCLGYLCAAMHIIPGIRNLKPIYVAYYFFLVNCAAAYGVGLLLCGRTIGVWKPQR